MAGRKSTTLQAGQSNDDPAQFLNAMAYQAEVRAMPDGTRGDDAAGTVFLLDAMVAGAREILAPHTQATKDELPADVLTAIVRTNCLLIAMEDKLAELVDQLEDLDQRCIDERAAASKARPQ